MPPETKAEDLEAVNPTAGQANSTANATGNGPSADSTVTTGTDRSSPDGMAHYPITPPYNIFDLVRPDPSEIDNFPPNTILPVFAVFLEQTENRTEMPLEVIGQFITLKLANECVLSELEKRSHVIKPEDSVCGVCKEGMIWWAWQNKVSSLADKVDFWNHAD
jgi:hypothetical protein